MTDLVTTPADGLAKMINQMAPAIVRALPKHITAERIARIAITAVRTNAKLAACSPQSFMGALLQSAQLGLEINTPLGHCYLVPYGQEATLIVGYKGRLELARRSGLVKSLRAYVVREGDEFDYAYGTDPFIKHVPQDDDMAGMIRVYAVAKLLDGEPVFTVLSRAKVESYRARSRAKDSGPWVTDYDAMAMKTAVHRLATWMPQSPEMARAHEVARGEREDVNQIETYSEEVREVIGTLPPPVPGATADGPPPEGKRISLKPKAKPEPVASTEVDDDAAALMVELGVIDRKWRSPAGASMIQGWTAEQRAEVREWFNAGDAAEQPAWLRVPS